MAAVNAIHFRGRIDARKSVTAETSSAYTGAASGTVAAQSVAGSVGGEVTAHFAGGNKNRSAGSTRAAHAASLWLAPLTSR
jgi:hypothetical protein